MSFISSTSFKWQKGQIRRFSGVLGIVCLPVSIRIIGDFKSEFVKVFFMEWIVDWIQAISFVAIGSELRVKLTFLVTFYQV